MKDLAPISLIGTSPQVLIINGKLPIKTLQEFVAWVKPHPKKFAYAGGGGPGSVSNLLMALFLKRAGLEMNAVSYRGTAPALTDIIGGHVPAMFVPLPEALPHAGTGAVRMLALSDDRRASQAKDVPTIAESGFPGFRGVSWNGMMAPAKTPREIIDRIANEFIRATKDPAFIAQLDKYGASPVCIHARAVRKVPSGGHRAVGGGGEDRRRDARQREIGGHRANRIKAKGRR